MSNLSDLLPAGGGAKVITATADGNLATGQTVALQSNGTVKGIAADANASSLGSAAIFAATGTGGTTDNCVAYDSVNNKILVAYKETNTGKGKAVVGTISGTSITFGTAAEFAANIQGDGGRRIGMCFNATEGKFVIVFRDNTINNYGRAVTATISGTSVSFGSSAVWSGTNATNHQACSFDYFGEHTSDFWELDGVVYHNIQMTVSEDSHRYKGEARYLQQNKDRATKMQLRQFRYIKFLKQNSKKYCLLKQQEYPKHYL